MKTKILTLIISFVVSFTTFSQINEFSTSDLRRVATNVGFEGRKKLKNLTPDDLMKLYLNIETDRALLRQININSWLICSHYKIDNFDTYNYYYNDVAKDVYNMYYKELNALMLIDGTISQLK